MTENWLKTYKTPGLKEMAHTLLVELYAVTGTKLKHTNALRNRIFKPEIIQAINKASEHLSGRYDMNNALVLGTIQCILINCYELSGPDMRRLFSRLQDTVENCIALIDYDYFNETDETIFIEISEYLNSL